MCRTRIKFPTLSPDSNTDGFFLWWMLLGGREGKAHSYAIVYSVGARCAIAGETVEWGWFLSTCPRLIRGETGAQPISPRSLVPFPFFLGGHPERALAFLGKRTFSNRLGWDNRLEMQGRLP